MDLEDGWASEVRERPAARVVASPGDAFGAEPGVAAFRAVGDFGERGIKRAAAGLGRVRHEEASRTGADTAFQGQEPVFCRRRRELPAVKDEATSPALVAVSSRRPSESW